MKSAAVEPLIIEIGQEVYAPPVGECLAVRSGWLAVSVTLLDIDRIVALLLPGDIVGSWYTAQFKLKALTSATLQREPAPNSRDGIVLDLVSRQCARLRLPGPERVKDLLSECGERLAAVGLGAGNDFEFPLSRRILGEILAMSEVHVCRVLAQLQKQGKVRIRRRQVWLNN